MLVGRFSLVGGGFVFFVLSLMIGRDLCDLADGLAPSLAEQDPGPHAEELWVSHVFQPHATLLSGS